MIDYITMALAIGFFLVCAVLVLQMGLIALDNGARWLVRKIRQWLDSID